MREFSCDEIAVILAPATNNSWLLWKATLPFKSELMPRPQALKLFLAQVLFLHPCHAGLTLISIVLRQNEDHQLHCREMFTRGRDTF